jgi:hypothetical protein
MRTHRKYIICLTIMILGWSCREVYYPDDIDSPEKIPVIEGMIQEGGNPYVKLSWAIGYNEQTKEYIHDAEIQVTDDLGNSVNLEETGDGYYTVFFDEFKGTVGRTYTLHVVLPGGNEYISSPAHLHNKPVIDSLYADPGIRIAYTYNAYNEPMAETQEGLFVLADMSEITDSVLYYRFYTRVVKEITYTQDPGTLFAQTVFVWKIYTLDNQFSVNHSVDQDNRQVLREHHVGFLHFDYDPSLETPIATAPYPEGWVLTFKVYAISAEVYDYYNSIAQQLVSNDQIFAPVPSQVNSTIKCLTDPSKKAIGVFEASSFTTVYKGFAWKDLDVYKSINLLSFPENLYNGTSIPFPPDFWVSFN